jgi:hypothetical protein
VFSPVEVVCAVAAVAFTADVGTQLAKHGGFKSKKAWANVKWDEVIISACGGAASGALAVAPLTTLGEVAANAVIGGTQAAENGGSLADIVEGTVLGGIAGRIGGPGYIKSYHESEYLSFSNAFYAKEALMGARKGIGGGAGTTVVGEIYNKVKGMFSGDENKKENKIVPAK